MKRKSKTKAKKLAKIEARKKRRINVYVCPFCLGMNNYIQPSVGNHKNYFRCDICHARGFVEEQIVKEYLMIVEEVIDKELPNKLYREDTIPPEKQVDLIAKEIAIKEEKEDTKRVSQWDRTLWLKEYLCPFCFTMETSIKMNRGLAHYTIFCKQCASIFFLDRMERAIPTMMFIERLLIKNYSTTDAARRIANSRTRSI